MYGQRLAGSQHIIEEQISTQLGTTSGPQNSVGHSDTIRHLALLQSSGERLLLSGSSDGKIKAWK